MSSSFLLHSTTKDTPPRSSGSNHLIIIITGTTIIMTTEQPSAPPPPSTTNNAPPTSQPQTATTLEKMKQKESGMEPEAAAVLAYLRKRGLGTAALELEKQLDEDKSAKKAKLSLDDEIASNEGNKTTSGTSDLEVNEKIVARKVAEAQENKTILNLSTGGRMGYDVDAAPEIIMWGVSSKKNESNDGSNKLHIQTGSKEEEEANDQQEEDTSEKNDKSPVNDREQWEQNEATRLVRAFTKLQTWVLTLPNDEHGNHASIETVLQHAKNAGLETSNTNATAADKSVPQTSMSRPSLIPPSIKPELIALCFPVMINTYCDLLQSGLENIAHSFLSTYRHVHQPYHPEEFLDLDRCQSQDDIKSLLNVMKKMMNTMGEVKKAKKELKNMDSKSKKDSATSSSTPSTPQKETLTSKIKSLEEEIVECQSDIRVYPFLKRVLSTKWQLNLSALTFQTLVRFFHSGDHGGMDLLPISAMLQNQCHLIVENRDPVSYVPGYILDDLVLGEKEKTDDKSGNITESKITTTVDEVKWAAPTDMTSRLIEAGEDANTANSILKKSERLPFPSFYLKSEYPTINDYKDDRKRVEFNRALLSNGFRRLEALDAKYEYENGMRTEHCTSFDGVTKKKRLIGNPMEPSIMFSTMCASSVKSSLTHMERASSNFPLNESSVDLTCAKLCLPDGRHVAAGCSDSAVRIWSMKSWNTYVGKSTVDGDDLSSPKESSIVLYGHKDGLPIYDIDWNRDGRTLLSAGGDGAVRLWDSKAVGPFGKLTSISKRSTKSSYLSKRAANKVSYTEPGTHVPGARPESLVEQHGSALACYEGHMKSSPVWSVAMSPSGYYFASAGSDSTARLWCTDRPTPVRILLGHYSQNINSVTWHPNCNYLLTGSDDKTIRMWDVQSGRSVRILSGCRAGINQVKVSPSGQYVAGTDYGGNLSIWDVRNGRKLKEYSCGDDNNPPIIHSISYSPCGSTIATGGDDCSIRIWDARGLCNDKSNPDYASSIGWGQSQDASIISNDSTDIDAQNPCKTFRTTRSIVLDLEFTKRNLLLSVGKYTQ